VNQIIHSDGCVQRHDVLGTQQLLTSWMLAFWPHNESVVEGSNSKAAILAAPVQVGNQAPLRLRGTMQQASLIAKSIKK
jgi:hypothetical protein